MTLFPPDPQDPQDPSLAPRFADEPRLLTRRDPAVADDPTEALPPADDSPQHRPQTSARAERRRARRAARMAVSVLLGAVLLSVVGLVAFTFAMRHAMHASLPQIDGSVRLPGLAAAVTVARNDHGVPSIQGAGVDDVIFAQGYVTAQDRLWQMDALRRHAAGELAEILGSTLVAHDRMQRTLQVRAAADRALPTLPADQKHQLEVYARGVNAFIDTHRDHLPLEFHLLHYAPAPWTPRDSLLVSLAMFQDLGTEFPTKLSREIVSAHLPAQLVADLYPVGNWRDHPPGQAVPDLTSPRGDILQIPLDPSQVKRELPRILPEDIDATRAALLQPACTGCKAGSNNWAVSGAHSASGFPLVSNDMHLSLSVPDIWYEASLHTADGALDVTGVTLPGTPFVIVGRNAHVAWGFTNLGGDVQDVYSEHTRGTGAAAEFQRADGTLAPLLHRAEHIRVRGGSDVQLDVLCTQHAVGSVSMETPVISGLYPREKRMLALAWTPYDPANLGSPFLNVNQAADGKALAEAFVNFGGPSLNLIWGDDGNHIGYHALGRIPVRGPAVHHPLVAGPGDEPPPPPSIPPGEALPPVDGEDSHALLLAGRPHLVLAGFRPVRRSRVAAPRPARPAAAPRTAAAPPIPAAPSLPDYVIGSPIPPMPVDALDANAAWSGYVPFAELPAAVDPIDGLLATANARITPPGYPYALGLDWISPYRVERIVHLLAGRNGLTPDDMLHTQMDIHSEMNLVLAQRITYALDHVAPGKDAARLKQVSDVLRRWDGAVTADSAAANIVAATRPALWTMLLEPQIAAHDHAAGLETKNARSALDTARLYDWGEQGAVLESLVTHAPKRWLPPNVATWDDLLAAAVLRGLAETHAPADLTGWGYGKSHPVSIEHPLLSASPWIGRLLGATMGSGPRVIGGDTSTIKATAHRFGPSERFTADLRDPSAATLNITTGQSGNPSSPWYMDQLQAWLAGTTFAAPLHPSGAVHTLTLTP